MYNVSGYRVGVLGIKSATQWSFGDVICEDNLFSPTDYAYIWALNSRDISQ